jgi:hypothetical protein
MTQMKNPIVQDGAGRCMQAKLPAYILSTYSKISIYYFDFSRGVL